MTILNINGHIVARDTLEEVKMDNYNIIYKIGSKTHRENAFKSVYTFDYIKRILMSNFHLE